MRRGSIVAVCAVSRTMLVRNSYGGNICATAPTTSEPTTFLAAIKLFSARFRINAYEPTALEWWG